MKKFKVLLILSLVSTFVFSQNLIRCETMEADSVLRAKNHLESLDDFENWLQYKIQQYKQSAAYNSGTRVVITLPVVFHVIHDGDNVGANENITAAQVLSQIDVLNEDFRRALGTLGYNTHPAGADVEIEFCPAVIDPNGNVMTEPGVDRVNLGVVSWDRSGTTGNNPDDDMKPNTIWDPEQYINIWTCRFGGSSANLLGYAQFPSTSGLQGLNNNGGAANTDGVVIRYTACGRVGTLDANYNKGRTLTHELGHFFGLRHIWGDQSCGNDYCDDTPTADGANYGCPTQNSCNDGTPDPNDMVENYMDYSDDECMHTFTLDQKDRILTVMQNSLRRANLVNSIVCTIPTYATITGQVIDATTLQGIPNALVFVDGATDYNVTADATGNFTIINVIQGNYTIYAGKWGYVTNTSGSLSVVQGMPLQTIALQKGYYDDFLFNFGWTVTGSATTGDWERGVPSGTTYTTGGTTYPSNPGADVSGDYLNLAMVTGNSGTTSGDDDVDGGNTIATSPAMDLTSFNDPSLKYFRWFFNSGGSGTPNDSLIISINNGTQTIDVDKVPTGAGNNQWTSKSYRVKDYFPTLTNNMKIICRTFDNTPGHIVEAGFDYLRVMDSTSAQAVAPVANFTSGTSSICVGETISFTDLSTNSPTGWNWQFTGGSPSSSTTPNPVITYNTAGVYPVSLTVTNGAGSNNSTLQGYITVTGVVAQFSQNNASICPGEQVTFANEAFCNPASILWVFQGGQPQGSTVDSPTVTYATPGIYDVMLIATNAFGVDTLVQSLAVQVYQPATLNAISTADTNSVGVGTATVNVSGGVTPYTYNWSNGATTQSVSGLINGVYTVTVTDANGCTSTTTVTVDKVDYNSIEFVGGVTASIYPNPSSNGLFNLKIKGIDKASGDYSVYNNLGQVITEGTINYNYNVINMQGAAKGIYFLSLRLAGKQQNIKLTVQ
jgi:zinc-dependent metalloproteinase lipoprotein